MQNINCFLTSQKGYFKYITTKESFNLRVTVNLYVLNVLENRNAIVQIATHHMIKFIVVIDRRYFSHYVAQSNYWIIQTFNEVRNSRVAKSSYETELRKMTSCIE